VLSVHTLLGYALMRLGLMLEISHIRMQVLIVPSLVLWVRLIPVNVLCLQTGVVLVWHLPVHLAGVIE
jgi:hypothetical protein